MPGERYTRCSRSSGHSDTNVTERYAHLSSKTLQDAANSASLIIKWAVPVAGVGAAVPAGVSGWVQGAP